jgi:hypothetical protein
VLLIPALRIVFWLHTELGCTGTVYINVFWQCVGIVFMLLPRILALTNNGLGDCNAIVLCSHPITSEFVMFFQSPLEMIGMLLTNIFYSKVCQQLIWIVWAMCCVSRGWGPICSVCICVCSIIFQGVCLPINLIVAGRTCLTWL